MKHITILIAICGYLGCGDSEPNDGVSYTTQSDETPMDNDETPMETAQPEGVNDPTTGQQETSSSSTPSGSENQESADSNGQSMLPEPEEQTSEGTDSTESAGEQVSSAPSDCLGLCEYMDACGLCFFDDNNECLELDACRDVCLSETPAPVASCIASLTACDESAYQGCFDDNAGNDDCAEACRVLDECDECFVDDAGTCLSIAGCALICRESTPPAAASCLASLTACDGIESCYQ